MIQNLEVIMMDKIKGAFTFKQESIKKLRRIPLLLQLPG